jgi:hypothetical protein
MTIVSAEWGCGFRNVVANCKKWDERGYEYGSKKG